MAASTQTLKRPSEFTAGLAARKARGVVFAALGIASVAVGLTVLIVLIADVLIDGLPWLDWQFINSFDSRFAGRAGIKAALYGTAYMMFFTILVSLPLGVMAAIYLEEYAPNNWFTSFIAINIANLAGVPSIIYGLLGLTVFVRWMALGRSVLAGALTMALLVLPIIIVATREALRAVPASMRQASLALGATRWQTIWFVLVPAARSGILASVILGMGRALGETMAVIMMLGNALQVPRSPLASATTLTSNIGLELAYASGAHREALFATGVVLFVLIMILNIVANLVTGRVRLWRAVVARQKVAAPRVAFWRRRNV